MSDIDPSTGQLLELPFDQSNFVMQDGSVLSTSNLQTSKSLLKPELAQFLPAHGYKSTVGRGGFTMGPSDQRWGPTGSPRGNRNLTRKPLNSSQPGSFGSVSQGGTQLLQTSSGILSLGSRYTPSSASVFGTNTALSGGALVNPFTNTIVPSSNLGVDREQNFRLAAAMAGTSGRGRPRGRRPLRGQFPVVPIDMVRQLGIEQQVILQPAAPVAMRNKAVLCRPLSMCRKTQVSVVRIDKAQANGLLSAEGVEELARKANREKDVENVAEHAEVGVNTPAEEPVQPARRKTLEMGVSTDELFSFTEECSQTEPDEEPTEPTPKIQFIPIPVPVPIFVPTPVHLYAQPVPYTLPFPLPCPIPFPFIPKNLSIFGEQATSASLTESEVAMEFDNAVPARSSALVPLDAMLPELVDSIDSGTVVPDEQSDQLVIGSEPVATEETTATTSTSETSLKRPASPLSSAVSAAQPGITTVESQPAVDTPAPLTQPEITSIASSDSLAPTLVIEPPVKRPRHDMVTSDANYRLKFSYGTNAWRHWIQQKLAQSNLSGTEYVHLQPELLSISESDLSRALSQFVREVRKPNGERYVADSVFYLCLGIQEYLNENGQSVNIFGGPVFSDFTKALDDILANFQPRINADGLLVCRIEEEHLWESRQLGHHTPEVLLFSILYFNTKLLGFRHGTDHRRLAFWQYQFIDEPKENTAVLCHLSGGFYGSPEADVATTVRFDANESDPERCPVMLLRTYCSLCPPAALTSDEAFYLTPIYPTPDRDCGCWYSSVAMDAEDLQVMLNRIKMVKEIQEAIMTVSSNVGD